MARQSKVVLLLILTTAVAAWDENQVKHRCPTGWVNHGRRCFIYQASRMDWVSAEKYCQYLGANLISIHSESEYNVLKTLIRAHDPQEDPTWIGLSGCQKINNFIWSDGTEVTYTKWNPGEPNFTKGECCVHVDWGGPKNWNDIFCDRSYSFACAMWLSKNPQDSFSQR